MKKLFSLILCVSLILANSATAANKKIRKVDIDFTKFNPVMVYSSLFNIIMEPKNYLGKTFKINGTFDFAQDESTGKFYYAVMVMDASACCSTGIDFVLKNNSKYPERGDNITVIGKFERYTEGDDVFYHLTDAELI